MVVFHLSSNISSEICKQFNNEIVYPPYTSMLCRQIIEQICFLKEVEHENIDVNLIVEADLVSYNKQIGSKSLNIEELNNNNKGLLKVFKGKKSYGKLAIMPLKVEYLNKKCYNISQYTKIYVY